MTFDKFSDMIFPVTKKGSFFCRGLQQQFFYMIKAGKASKSFSLLFFIPYFPTALFSRLSPIPFFLA